MITRILAPVTMFLIMSVPAILLLVLQFSSTTVHAGQLDDWYLKQLFEPSQAQLVAEQRGKVFIYSGLKDTQVARAMDEHFNRVENMMFANTIVTDADGRVKKNSLTGEVVVEDDGC